MYEGGQDQNVRYFLDKFFVADYFGSLAAPLRESVMQLPDATPDFIEAESRDWSGFKNLICHVINVAQLSATYVLQAKATSNTSPDIELGERK